LEYFSDESVAEEDIPRYQEQYRGERLVEQIALRSSSLDKDAKQLILHTIDYVRKLQGLDD
jgi:hypothetical protein